jgi:hypothetical protein
MHRSIDLEVALDVERQLDILAMSLPKLAELPIAPLRGVDDLVRLELALPRFAEIHRSKRSKVLIRAVRRILESARVSLRKTVPAVSQGLGAHQIPFRDTQPAM